LKTIKRVGSFVSYVCLKKIQKKETQTPPPPDAASDIAVNKLQWSV